MDNVSVITSFALIGLFLLTFPAEGYVALNIDREVQRRLQLSRWKRQNELIMGDNENKPYKPVDGELVYASEDNNELPDQKEIFFNSVYKPEGGEASGSQTATENNNKNISERETRDPVSNEQESKTVPLTNEQQIKENEVDFGRNTAAIITLPSSMPSRL